MYFSGEEQKGPKCFCLETYQAITTSELCGLVCAVSSSKSLIVQNHPKYRILPTRVAKSWAKMCESARATPAAPLASVITTRWRAVPTLSKEAAGWGRGSWYLCNLHTVNTVTEHWEIIGSVCATHNAKLISSASSAWLLTENVKYFVKIGFQDLSLWWMYLWCSRLTSHEAMIVRN